MSATKEHTMKIDLGRGSLLGVAFIVLRLVGVIHWSWVWVLAPFWIPFAIGLAVVFLVGLFSWWTEW
jgi:hypothetical protein